MAGKYGSADALFLVDGYNFLAAKVKTLALKIVSITEESDGLGDNYQAFSPVGKQQGMLTQGGAFFDTTALSIHDGMATKLGSTPQSTARVICVGIMGNTMGAVCYGIQGAFSVAYEVALDLGKLTKANAEHLLAGLIERGSIVQPLAVKTADWNTKTLGTSIDYTTDLSQFTIPITSNSIANPTVVTTPVPHGLTTGQVILISGVATSSPTINGERTVTVTSTTTFTVPVNVTVAGTGGSFVLSSTVNGGAGYQEVTAFSGFTGFIGKVRHSADDTTYADLAVFTNVTSGPNAQRVAVAAGTTVNRYLCYDGDVTGSGSITAMAMFART
jgi:hypothetical protein